MKRLGPVLWAAALGFALSACSGSRPVASDEYASSAAEDTGPQSAGLFGAGGLALTLGGEETPHADLTPIGVNEYLWWGALQTVGFVPLQSADPFGGVIISDWHSMPGTPDERFRIAIYIVGKHIRSDAVRVLVTRQVRNGKIWADAPVASSMVRQLTDDVLAHAEQLRSHDLEG